MLKIRIDQDNFSKEDINFIAKEILAGKIAVLPTDTIYGLSVLATNREAVERLYQLKNRPREKSFIVLVKSFCMLRKYCFLNKKQYDFIKKAQLNNKPLSVILKARAGKLEYLFDKNNNSLAVRIPLGSDFMMSLIKKVNQPIISTSVNLSGKEEMEKISNLENIFNKKDIDLVIDSGSMSKKKASTVVDLRDIDNIKILRG